MAAADPAADGLLVILTPQAMTDPTETAEALVRHAQIEGKPVLASWMGGPRWTRAARILREAGIPTFAYPDTARAHVQPPVALRATTCGAVRDARAGPRRRSAATAREASSGSSRRSPAEGRTLLTEVRVEEGPRRLRHPHHRHARRGHAGRGRRGRRRDGLPGGGQALLRGRSPTRPTSAACVLNLRDGDAVREAFERDPRGGRARRPGVEHFEGVTVQPMINWTGYELIVGSSPDPQFGPVLLFGMGGQLVEVFRDRALGAAAAQHDAGAAHDRARRRSSDALEGVRGRQPVDMDAARAAARPLQRARGGAAADRGDRHQPAAGVARAAHRARCAGRAPPCRRRGRRPAAARDPAVPARVRAARGRREDGVAARVRPIRPEDEPLLVRFHERTVRGDRLGRATARPFGSPSGRRTSG